MFINRLAAGFSSFMHLSDVLVKRSCGLGPVAAVRTMRVANVRMGALARHWLAHCRLARKG